VQPQELAEARERLEHFFVHYILFRPHQRIDGLLPVDRFFGAEETLRRTLEGELARDELGLAVAASRSRAGRGSSSSLPYRSTPRLGIRAWTSCCAAGAVGSSTLRSTPAGWHASSAC
jgi:hypothetical protein